MSKIFIVEDEPVICRELESLLTGAGYEALVLQDFENAVDEILTLNPDLILLDIGLPYQNGEFLLQSLRKKSNIPVIMVTSKSAETDEVLSMSFGADDYITKPYNPHILLLRIAAVLKRTKKIEETSMYQDIEINIQKGILKRKEIEIILTKNEMIIFTYLLHHKNRIVSRDELMTDLWNNQEYINDNALTVNISRLRSKLKSLGMENAIDTRKGQGYILL